MSKVVIICGNKRAGKTTLSTLLHKEYNFNYFNFDMLLDALETAFPQINDGDEDKYISLLEQMVESSLKDSANHDISTVYDYIFTPKQLSTFKYKDDVEIYFLANLDATIENIKADLLNYSQSYDWPSYASEEDLTRNINYILSNNLELIEETKKYGFQLINTSRGENRDKILRSLAETIISNDIQQKR